MDQALSLYLHETIPMMDPQAADYALVLLTLVESILEDPDIILRKQLDKVKAQKMAEMKMEGIEYDERMEELEKLEAEVTLQAPDIENKRGEVDRELQALEQEAAAADQRLASIGKRRAELAEQIPKKLVDMYERVARGRRGQALSEVRNSTCTACRMRVRLNVFSDVRRVDQLITCDNCSRILFYRPDTSKSAEAVVS